MKNNERLVQYYDVQIYAKTRARDIKHKLNSPRTLDDLMGEFAVLREKNVARKRVEGRSKYEYRLEDMEERDDSWVLLVNVVDGQAAHPVTQKIGGTKDDREVIVLGKDRGLESSTHIIIYKAQDEAKKHLVLYEKTTGVSSMKAAAFLSHMARLAAKSFPERYELPHPNGAAGKSIKVYCDFEWLGHPSDEFRSELDDGVIADLRLTSDVNIVKGYDSNAFPELISTEIKMKVSMFEVAMAGGNWSYLQKAIRYADTLDAPFVRISFKDHSNTSHTAILSSDTGKMWNAERYVKKRRIVGFENSLRTAFPNIHNGIVQKMTELLL